MAVNWCPEFFFNEFDDFLRKYAVIFVTFFNISYRLVTVVVAVVVIAVGLGIVSAFTLVSLSMLLSVACYRRCRCVYIGLRMPLYSSSA